MVVKLLQAALLLGAAGIAAGQAWPSKPIRYVVPFAAGGTTDVLQPELQKALGVAIVIDNKPGITATLAGEVQMMFDNATIAIPHIKSGRLRALAVTTAQRSAALPEVPTKKGVTQRT